MSTLKTKCHIKALRDNMERIIIASLLALIADLGWLFHDVYNNGISAVYFTVGSGLFIGIVGTGRAWIVHHNEAINKMLLDLKKKRADRVQAELAAKEKRSKKLHVKRQKGE